MGLGRCSCSQSTSGAHRQFICGALHLHGTAWIGRVRMLGNEHERQLKAGHESFARIWPYLLHPCWYSGRRCDGLPLIRAIDPICLTLPLPHMQHGCPALLKACGGGHTGVVELLTTAGADVQAEDGFPAESRLVRALVCIYVRIACTCGRVCVCMCMQRMQSALQV